MPIHDFTSQRLFVDVPLADAAEVALSPDQAHYLRGVLRLADGAEFLVFNGRDGEWRVRLLALGKKGARLHLVSRERAQEEGPAIDYAFAPLKRARLDYLVQKATELGAARLSPVITQHTVAERVNIDRMRANVIEAAEQCGILRLPVVDEPLDLPRFLAGRDPSRLLVYCDERAAVSSPIEALAARLEAGASACVVLIGPEGGFAANERALIAAQPNTVALSLGPRIMRADTAAVAALALVNSVLGDWR